jgi:hypothetical protein
MNGFLVMLRCNMEDVPLAFYATLDFAAETARRAAKFPDAAREGVIGKIDYPGRSALNHVLIVRFEDGQPVQTVAGFEIE